MGTMAPYKVAWGIGGLRVGAASCSHGVWRRSGRASGNMEFRVGSVAEHVERAASTASHIRPARALVVSAAAGTAHDAGSDVDPHPPPAGGIGGAVAVHGGNAVEVDAARVRLRSSKGLCCVVRRTFPQ